MLYDQNIAVIIPAHNEENTIAKVVSSLPDFIDHIIVVDDGSTDGTVDAIGGCSCQVVMHDKRKGLGGAFRSGIKAALTAGCDMAVTVDGDDQFDVSCIEDLVAVSVKQQADVVLGSRFLNGVHPAGMPLIKLWGNKTVSFIVSQITGEKFDDVSCGFRAYGKEALLRLNVFGKFTYTHESILTLAFQGLRIIEVPVRVKAKREAGKPKISSNLLMYGLRTLKIIFQTYRDFKPFKFFHTIGLVFLMVSFVLGAFTLSHFLMSGEFTPYKIVGLLSIIGFFIYVICLMTGFLIEGVARIRYNQEYMMFLIKSQGLLRKENNDLS